MLKIINVGEAWKHIGLEATNYITLEVIELQQSYPREKTSLAN